MCEFPVEVVCMLNYYDNLGSVNFSVTTLFIHTEVYIDLTGITSNLYLCMYNVYTKLYAGSKISILFVFVHRLSHGFGQFGLGSYQYYRLVYDFSHFCLKIYIGQLDFCRRKSNDYYPDIIDEFMSLIQHLKQSITKIMNIFIPNATKPLLYVICPFCEDDTTPHIKFDFNAPVLCCERGKIPREVARSRYIPCGIDLKDMKKSGDCKKIVVCTYACNVV